MTKGKWLSRALHVTIALSFILGALVVAPSVSADPGTSKWEKQGTPTEDDKVILPGSDITDFDVAGDGETIYAIGTWFDSCKQDSWNHGNAGPLDLPTEWHNPKLWKSTDGGVTWSDKTSKALGAKNLPDMGGDGYDFTYFTAVSVAPDDADFVVVTGWGYDDNGTPDNYIPIVVGSNDGAGKFYYMGCSTVSGMITCVDVSMEVDDKHSIAVGTWDWEHEAGGSYTLDNATVWRYDAGGYWSAYWADTSGLDGWNYCDAIIDLEFSPNYDVDDTIVVLCVDDVDGAEVDSDWNDDADTSEYDFLGFKLQAGTWNSIDAWNGEAEFDGYPVVIRNDDYEIVSPLDGDMGYVGVSQPWDIVGQLVRNAGDIDLPFDYMGDDNGERKVMCLVNGLEVNMSGTDSLIDDGGFMFWIENTTISLELLDHEDNPYIASIDYNGNVDMEGRTLAGLAFPKDWRWMDIWDWFGEDETAGCCNGVQVLRSETTDVCCPDWDWSCKPPSGQFMATVMMNPDGDIAYAGTMGESWTIQQGKWWSDESAFSISDADVADLGKSWNQESLIDTDIDFISDVAVTTNGDGDDECSPSCQCLYIATINEDDKSIDGEGKICDCDSIWRSCDGGSTWLRIWHKELQGAVMDPTSPGGCWPQVEAVEWMVLGLVPGEEEAETIYMADIGSETVWVSTDGGSVCCPAGLGCWTHRDTGLGMWDDEGDLGIADIAVLDSETIYVVAFNGDMVKSTTMARHWSSQEDTKVDDDDEELAHDIVALGDYVLVGGSIGTVSYSDDGGDSFSVLDDIGGDEWMQVHLAFDSYFDDNGYIYAATAEGGGGGVYRTTIDAADFKSMDACEDLNYFGIVVSDGGGNSMTSASTGGVLYASYNSCSCLDRPRPIDAGVCPSSGVARILNPASQSCCGSLSWDYLFTKLWDHADFRNQQSNIAICGDASGGATTIWAIDIAGSIDDDGKDASWAGWGGSYYRGWNWDCPDRWTEFSNSNVGRLWKYNDVFAKGGPELIGVADGTTIPSDPCDCVNEDFVLEWDRICDACEYDIEIAMDEGFKHKVWKTTTLWGDWNRLDLSCHNSCDSGLMECCEDSMCFYKPSDPCAPSIVVPQGTLDCNQTYWWRVRARAAETGEVYRSWWSDKWSFTVAVGPDGAIKLTAPVNGAMNVPLGSVVFTWTAVADCDSYEMVLMDGSGAELASNSGDATSFVMTSDLDYDSAYMWQVTAMKGSNVLSESGVSTFHTMSEAVPPPEYPETVINFPEPPGTPTWVWVVIALAAVLIIVVIVLIFRTRRV